MKAMGARLALLQLRFGTSLGCEAAAHVARTYLDNMDSNHLMLNIDFGNTFNCLRRDKMPGAVRETVPKLYHFVHCAYEMPSSSKPSTWSKGTCISLGDP